MSDDKQAFKDSIDDMTWTKDDDGNQVKTDFAQTTLGAEIIDNLHKMNSQGRISYSACPGGDLKASGAYNPDGKFSDNKSTIEIASSIKNDLVERAAFLAHEGMHAIQHKNGQVSPQGKNSEREAFFAEFFVRQTVSGSSFWQRDVLQSRFDRRSKENEYRNDSSFESTPGISGLVNGYANTWVSQQKTPLYQQLAEAEKSKKGSQKSYGDAYREKGVKKGSARTVRH